MEFLYGGVNMKKVLVVFLFVLFSFSSISYGETPDPEKWHYSSSGAGRSYYLYIPDLKEANKIYTNNKILSNKSG